MYTGVDFAGPIYVCGCEDISQKARICLFTCYVTRDVHLEATPDQSTETFLPEKILCQKRLTWQVHIRQRQNIQGCIQVPQDCSNIVQSRNISLAWEQNGYSMWNVRHGGEVHLRGW